MKRKFLMIFCAAALSVGLLAGCGGDAKEDTKTENQSETQDNQTTDNSEEDKGSTAIDLSLIHI